MSTRSRTPSLLEPYLKPPPETSLTLLTGTLGCTANWLSALFVSSLLSQQNVSGTNTGDGENEKKVKVVFASWLRDLSFWKTEFRRTIGLDTSKSIAQNQLVFLDYLNASLNSQTEDALSSAGQSIADSISKLSSNQDSSRDDTKIILVLDAPDILLATASTTAQEINTLLLRLRSNVHATILSCSADLPLLSAASSQGAQHLDRDHAVPLPIEVETANFLVQQAHLSSIVMSVRDLDTGAARDVSGVLRVTKGGICYDYEDEVERVDGVREMEVLYLVQRDGNVKVFQRGTDA